MWPEEDELGDTMIINMGPQHPSTHGVLRLMMELDSRRGLRIKPVIGYLHTGMEKTGEELTYVQGGTNVTRMDYAAPFSNELVYSLAVERLLDVEVPGTRAVDPHDDGGAQPHVVAPLVPGDERHGHRRGLDDALRLAGARRGAAAVRDVHRPAHEPQLHPARRRRGRPARRLAGGSAATWRPRRSGRRTTTTSCCRENPIWRERTVGVGIITTEECLARSITGPILRSTGFAWDLRKAHNYLPYDEVDWDVVYASNGDVFDRYRIRLFEILESAKIVRQCVEKMPAGDFRVQDKKITPPPRARIDESMEALIHHFKLFTEGFKVPPGETYVAIESPRGEIGCYMVSDGSGKPVRMHIRGPSFYNLQATEAMTEGSLVADAVAIVSSIDPIMGEVDR